MSASTQEVIQELPPYLAAAYREAVERGLQLSRERYEPYQGQRLAPHHAPTRRALNLAENIGSFAPYNASINHHIAQGTRHFPNHYQQYMQPYQADVVDKLEGLGQRSFNEGFMPELEKRFASRGPGLARHPNFSNQAARDIHDEIRSQQEDAMSRGYGYARDAFNIDNQRSLEAARLMNALGMSHQGAQVSDIESLMDTGLMSQIQEQAILEQAYEEWKERRNWPYEKLKSFFDILKGGYKTPSGYIKEGSIPPSDTYHHGDWRNIAEGVGLNALGGILSGQQPSPAILAAFSEALPGSSGSASATRSERERERKRALEAQRVYEELGYTHARENPLSSLEAYQQWATGQESNPAYARGIRRRMAELYPSSTTTSEALSGSSGPASSGDKPNIRAVMASLNPMEQAVVARQVSRMALRK